MPRLLPEHFGRRRGSVNMPKNQNQPMPSGSAFAVALVMTGTGETDPRVISRIMGRDIEDDLDELHALGWVHDGAPLGPVQ